MMGIANTPSIQAIKKEVSKSNDRLLEIVEEALVGALRSFGIPPIGVEVGFDPAGGLIAKVSSTCIKSTTGNQILEAVEYLIREGCINYGKRVLSHTKHPLNTSVYYKRGKDPTRAFWMRLYNTSVLYDRLASNEITEEEKVHAVYSMQCMIENGVPPSAREIYTDVFNSDIPILTTAEMKEIAEKFLFEILYTKYFKQDLIWNTISILGSIVSNPDTPADTVQLAENILGYLTKSIDWIGDVFLCELGRVLSRYRKPGAAIVLMDADLSKIYPTWKNWLVEFNTVAKKLPMTDEDDV